MLAMATQAEPRPWRCKGVRPNGQPCRQLLARTIVAKGSVVEIVCHRCGTLNVIDKGAKKPAA